LSLVEVLVTMVIVSVGLLGVAGLQLKALKNTYASFQRSLATLQAQDLVDRIWASTCVLSNATQRGNIKSEWQAVHSASASTKLSMPNWAGDFTYTASTGLFVITVSWKDVMVNPSQAAAGDNPEIVPFAALSVTLSCSAVRATTSMLPARAVSEMLPSPATAAAGRTLADEGYASAAA
jgi:type IV pilus assembly protein PilV